MILRVSFVKTKWTKTNNNNKMNKKKSFIHFLSSLLLFITFFDDSFFLLEETIYRWRHSDQISSSAEDDGDGDAEVEEEWIEKEDLVTWWMKCGIRSRMNNYDVKVDMWCVTMLMAEAIRDIQKTISGNAMSIEDQLSSNSGTKAIIRSREESLNLIADLVLNMLMTYDG